MSNLSYTDPFAPKPRSYADTAADYLQRAREALHSVTPNAFGHGVSSFIGAGPTMAPNLGSTLGVSVAGATQPDILNNQAARIAAAYPDKFGGAQANTNALFGPSTYPQTTQPRPEGFNGVAPAAPVAAPAPVVAPAPAVADGGYNAIDAAATPPVVSSSSPSQAPAPVGNPAAPVVANGSNPIMDFLRRNAQKQNAPTGIPSDTAKYTGDMAAVQKTTADNANALTGGADLIKQLSDKYFNKASPTQGTDGLDAIH